MQIGGYDTIIRTLKKPKEFMYPVLKALRGKWPFIRIILNDENVPIGEIPGEFPDVSGCVLAARDMDMQKHWDLTGGTLMEDGEGPLSFHYSKKGVSQYELTIVTPDDPDVDPFSSWVCKITKQACSGVKKVTNKKGSSHKRRKQ